MLDEALEYFYERRSGRLQFLEVVERKCFEKFFAVAGELDEDSSAVIGSAQAGKETSVDKPIDQLDSAVMLQLHSLRQNTDGRLKAVGKASHRQQQLVLLWLDAGGARDIFAETQKAADLIAQLRHRFKVGDFGCLRHIISDYDNIV
jgi:hypothetical protein